MASRGRKDAFPGADGSTIQANGNATTIPIYQADGSALTEGSVTGLRLVDITTGGVVGGDNTTLVYAIKNPLAFVYNTASPLDWYTNNETYQNNTLWGENQEKSIYDPCPQGWRVPQDGTWADFLTSTAPYYINGTYVTTGVPNITAGRRYKQAWYPAGGFRDRTTAMLNTMGSYGHCWSAAASNFNAIYLHFTITSITPSNAYYRAYGFPIRCVQE